MEYDVIHGHYSNIVPIIVLRKRSEVGRLRRAAEPISPGTWRGLARMRGRRKVCLEGSNFNGKRRVHALALTS